MIRRRVKLLVFAYDETIDVIEQAINDKIEYLEKTKHMMVLGTEIGTDSSGRIRSVKIEYGWSEEE